MLAPLDPGLRGALFALCWLGGIGLQLQQTRLWPLQLNLSILAAAAALLGIGVVCRRAATKRATLRVLLATASIALIALGFSSTALRAEFRLRDALPDALQGRDIVVTGVIDALPQPSLQGTRFVFDVEQAELEGQPVTLPPRLSLGWYRGFDGDALVASPMHELRVGQRWQLTVRLQQPHGTLNPHGFDLELWLFEQGIGASGSVRARPDAIIRKLADDVGHHVDRTRQRVRDAIWLRVGDVSSAGVLAALAVGDQGAIRRDDWDLFRATGVSHLMSISGLHVTMFAWLAGGLIALLWRCSSSLMLLCPVPPVARWGGVIAATGYAVLAGWGVPAQRTLLMLATLALLRSLGVRWPTPLVLLAAAVVVTCVDPWALLQAGFWLSFAAVALLMGSQPVAPASAPADPASAGRWLGVKTAAVAGLRTQWVASIGLTPLSMLFFHQISVVGFIANLLAIPLVSLLITPLALLGIVLPALWAPASALVQGLSTVLAWLATWPFATWAAPAATGWVVAGGLLGATLLLLPLPARLRWLGLPLLLPLLAPAIDRPAEGEFEVLAADIGQGTAVLVRTREHLLVYDTGPRYSESADAGQRVLLPLLGARGENRIDLLMLSHSDSDHVGGAASLLAHADVRALASSLGQSHPLRSMGPPHQRCEAGQGWLWDGVRFELLHPLAEDFTAPRKPNALSCVLRVQSRGGRSLLLTGDIEAAQESRLVESLGAALHSDVLLVPHHGSRTSSTVAFVQAVDPQTAVVQAAYRSRFGHPAADVQARYAAAGITLKRSDVCGAWLWQSDSADATGTCERDRAARYWHHRPNVEP
ncbi:MAG: DNA internalization-related competence protein ComEC/Rec2, partial [Rubrivivax sp.]